MKKYLLLLLAPLMLLTGCDNGTTFNPVTGTDSKKESESISLTTSNYGEFVAPRINQSTDGTGLTSSAILIVTGYFEGSNLVKFSDCSITCHYQLGGSERVSPSYNVKLTISGDGYIPSYSFTKYSTMTVNIVVTAVSGTVTYLI